MSFVYRGLTATLNRHIVTDEEIDRQLEHARQQYPRVTVIKDRPTQSGDEILLDYAGFCDGEQFAGGTAEQQTLVLGSGTFIPGFEEQLLDKMPGEKVTVHVTFPAQYHADALAGKAAEFRCTIHEIHAKSLYELDDTFAREVGGCATFARMREKMGASMQQYADEQSEMELQEQLLRQAAMTMDYTVDPEELEKAVNEQIRNMEAQLAQQGLNLEMYCSFMGTTVEDMRKDAYPAAEDNLRNLAAISKIAEEEKLVPAQEELEQALTVIARQNQLTLEQLKSYCDEEFEKAVYKSVLTSKVMRLIRDAADITVVK